MEYAVSQADVRQLNSKKRIGETMHWSKLNSTAQMKLTTNSLISHEQFYEQNSMLIRASD